MKNKMIIVALMYSIIATVFNPDPLTTFTESQNIIVMKLNTMGDKAINVAFKYIGLNS
jgi:hypothetical protein